MKNIGWISLNLLQASVLVVWSTFCVICAMVSRLFGRDVPLFMARVWSRPLMWIGFVHYEVERTTSIDWSKPHIYVMNHQSMLDIPAAFLAVQAPLRFIAKKSLASVPFLGWYMKATGMIFVDREKSARAVASIQEAGVRIREGASIVAFPEGTRSRDGRIGSFKKGTFMVALEAQVPIVPMAIHGASYVLPRDGFRVRPGRIRVKMGAPIPTEGLTRADRNELIRRIHMETIRLHLSIGGAGGKAEVPGEEEVAQADAPVAAEDPGRQTA